MSDTIRKLTIRGFKSIQKLEDFKLEPLNVLIGANGAGKSNFVGFFRLLRELVEQRLARLVEIEGGADRFLYLGPKITQQIRAEFYFGANGYRFVLEPTNDGRLIFADEATQYSGYGWRSLGSGHRESKLKDHKDDTGAVGRHRPPYYVFNSVSNWEVYHFHDTSGTAAVRRQGQINDNEFLHNDAGNLAAFLYRLSQANSGHYQKIRDVIRLAAPFFNDFKLRPIPANPNLIQLEWTQRDSDNLFFASQLSDGTLRFMCLATALLQPRLPRTVLLDEPELGLHPYALSLLANLFRQAASPYGFPTNQVIVSTQSALLLNELAPEDVVIVERTEGQSAFTRLDPTHLSEWLQEYALGELWQKNVLGGRPRSEETPQFSNVNPSGEGKNS